MRILKDIYNHEYFPSEPLDEMPPELYNKQQEFREKVEESMGKEFVAKCQEELYDIQNFRGYINFRDGFRLGVSLMLELL